VAQPQSIDAAALPWTPHRTYQGVYARVLQGAETCADLEVRWVRIAPGTEISQHVHEHSAETYVLAGEGAFAQGGDLISCHAGSCGFAAAGASHGVKNTGKEDLHLLAIFTPPLNR
jgi:quercetin dioxygenase-like cupin family protein